MNVMDAAMEQGNKYGYVTKRGTLTNASGHFCAGDSTADDINTSLYAVDFNGVAYTFRPESLQPHPRSPSRNYCHKRTISAWCIEAVRMTTVPKNRVCATFVTLIGD